MEVQRRNAVVELNQQAWFCRKRSDEAGLRDALHYRAVPTNQPPIILICRSARRRRLLAVELYEFHSITKLQHAILVTATNTVVMISEKAFTGIFAHGDQTVDNICLLYTSDAADDLLCVDL